MSFLHINKFWISLLVYTLGNIFWYLLGWSTDIILNSLLSKNYANWRKNLNLVEILKQHDEKSDSFSIHNDKWNKIMLAFKQPETRNFEKADSAKIRRFGKLIAGEVKWWVCFAHEGETVRLPAQIWASLYQLSACLLAAAATAHPIHVTSSTPPYLSHIFSLSAGDKYFRPFCQFILFSLIV